MNIAWFLAAPAVPILENELVSPYSLVNLTENYAQLRRRSTKQSHQKGLESSSWSRLPLRTLRATILQARKGTPNLEKIGKTELQMTRLCMINRYTMIVDELYMVYAV